jgi:peptidyl-prolyl cis-trans isomerase D
MLDVLRASKGGIITWVFLGAIIFMFVVFFGPGSLVRGESGGCGAPPAYAARVNGESISVATFYRQYSPIADTYERDPQGAAMLPYLAQQILNRLVDQALLSQEAERRGIQISTADLVQRVKEDPSFQVDGQFSQEKYQKLAPRQFGSVTGYEALVRQGMRLERLQAAIQATIQVPESEVHDTWKTLSDTYDVSYVLFPTVDARAEVKVTDAEVQAFAAKEGARIEKFYKDNAARYDQPKKVRARHILAKIQGSDDAARKRIQDAIMRLQKGEDFAKLATEMSDDVNTKAAGGELGIVSPGTVDEAFSKAALELEAGKFSGPVKTLAGWHVIKVDEVIPAKKIPLETARMDIARELLSGDRATALVHEKAEAALKAVQSGKKLAELFPEPKPATPATDKAPASPEVKAALTLGGHAISERSTGPTPASVTTIPGVEGSSAFVKDALAAQAGAVLPKVYDLPGGAVVAVVKSRVHPDEAKYPAERHAHELALRGEKARQMETVWLQQLRAKANIQINDRVIPRARDGQAAPPLEQE